MSGWANVNPAASSLVGATRCPASSISSPIWPNAAFTAAAGSGKIVGRCSARPSAFVKSRFVTVPGSGDVDRPFERMVECEQVCRDGVGERDPAPPLAAVPDPPAGAELERRQEPLERPTMARQHDPLPEMHRPQSRGPRGLGRRLPRLDDLGQEPLARAPSPRQRSRRRGRRRTRSRTRRAAPACRARRRQSPPRAACPRRGSRAPLSASPRSSVGRCFRRRGARSRPHPGVRPCRSCPPRCPSEPRPGRPGRDGRGGQGRARPLPAPRQVPSRRAPRSR